MYMLCYPCSLSNGYYTHPQPIIQPMKLRSTSPTPIPPTIPQQPTPPPPPPQTPQYPTTNNFQQNRPISMKNYRQDPREVFSTYPLLITQLEKKNMEISANRQLISQLQLGKYQKQGEINTMSSIMHSFYTKGVPVQSAISKQIFDGSYPTLIEQADSMRKKIAIKQQQLSRLKMEKGRDAVQLMDARYRVVTYANRIRDLEYRLEEVYRNRDRDVEEMAVGRGRFVERENVELRNQIMEMERRNERIADENKHLNQIIQTLTTNRYQRAQNNQKQQPTQNSQKQQHAQTSQIPKTQISTQQPPHKVITTQIFTPPQNTPPQNPPSQNTPSQNPPPQNPPPQTQPLLQLHQLHQKLHQLRQQNIQLLEQQQTYIQQIYNDRQPQISMLDDKQRNPFQLSKNNTTATGTGNGNGVVLDGSRLGFGGWEFGRKSVYGVGEIEDRIRELRSQSSVIMGKK